MDKPFMLHITKTGGTALKWLEHQKIELPFELAPMHHFTLAKMKAQGRRTAFIIRDPLERFCSGFWEAKTQPEREKIAISKKDQSRGFWLGYGRWNEIERELLPECQTPNDLLKHWRIKGDHKNIRTGVLYWTTVSLRYWLGRLAQYRCKEDCVDLVIESRDLTQVMLDDYGIEMPLDPFYRRDRNLFDIPRDDTISEENQIWFQETFRFEDYQLIDYIRSRPYYRGSANQQSFG